MPKLRKRSAQQVDEAIEELVTLVSESRGLCVARQGHDRIIITVGSQSWPAAIIARDAVSLRTAHELVATSGPTSNIVIANQLSSEAKDFLTGENTHLRDYHWSWLDRRGELQLNHPNATGVIHFDASTANHRPTLPGGWKLSAPGSDGPIRGRAGISYAAAVLLEPRNPPSIRAVAKRAAMSHGAIGTASKLLRDAGLIRPNGEPQIPELFRALAGVWNPTRITPVNHEPTPNNSRRLQANPKDEGVGWCLGGDDSAAAWGAPVFTAAVHPWIWVPNESDARRAERALIPGTWDDYAAVIAVPPTALVCSERRWPPRPGRLPFLPTTHPLFLALELAQDPSRGREILEQWRPTEPGIAHVW